MSKLTTYYRSEIGRKGLKAEATWWFSESVVWVSYTENPGPTGLE